MKTPLIGRARAALGADALPARHRSPGGNWALSVLGSATFALLLYMSALQLQDGELPVASAPMAVPQANWQADFPERIARVTEALQRLPVRLPTPSEEPQGAGALRWVQRHYELTVPPRHDPAAIEQLFDPVRAAAPGVTLQVIPDPSGAHIQIGVDYLLTHSVTLHWLERNPRVAIIVDQLGDDLLVARAFAGLGQPLTFAVMPHRPFSKEVAELAKLFGREVLLQIRAEPDRTAGRDVAGRDELARELDKQLASVPYAVGLSDMDSGFVERGQLSLLMDVLKQKGLFLVDGETAAGATPCEVAATTTVACAAPSHWFEDSDDPGALETQIANLLKGTRTRGDGIVVIRARLPAVTALRQALPRFAEAGVDLVAASVLVRDQIRR